MLGVIFRKAQNKIQDRQAPLADRGPDRQRAMVSLSADVKGDAYEGLLQKNAEDVKGGAGQYFTPRPLIAAMVDVIAPQPGQAICDPACGTGGFLLAAHDYLASTTRLIGHRRRSSRAALLRIELVDIGKRARDATRTAFAAVTDAGASARHLPSAALRPPPGIQADLLR